MIHPPVYLDNNATTRTDPRVLEAMLPYFTEHFGNAASRTHAFGWTAAEAVDQTREQVADLIGAGKKDIIFTSGATESNNLALKGVAHRLREKGQHIVTTAIEHRSVLDPCKRLEGDGFTVTFLPVDRLGRVTPEQVAAALTEETILVSVMAANNEVGTVQPIGEIGRLCKDRGILFHTDAVQATGTQSLDVEEMGIDLLSLTAHKIYGPKGVGALYVRRRNPCVLLDPLFDGGGHERRVRSGTLPVPLIVGFGAACAWCLTERETEVPRLLRLRERLRAGIMEKLTDVSLNGHPTERLPGNLNLSFGEVDGSALLMQLREVAVSSGSACTSADSEPSYVLRALGIGDERAHGSLRFGVGRFTSEEEVDFAIAEVMRVINYLRGIRPERELTHGRY